MFMRVCFIALEYFGWGRYGGIGKATRDTASGLVGQAFEVSVVVPLSVGERRHERVDGVDVYGFKLHEYPLPGGLLREIDADIYHSQDPTFGTWLAKRALPERVHLLTCQNPKTDEDWEKVNQFYPARRRIYNKLVEPRVKNCVKELDKVYCQAKYISEKAKSLYELDYNPGFLPNPVVVSNEPPEKAEDPTVLFLGRFDGEKNPERFMEMATRFHDVNFIAAGASHNSEYDRILRKKYGDLDNLRLVGFVDGEEKERLLDESWVLVNTSVSECLPVSFLEASAHGCSILSPHDPDRFASRFGYHVKSGSLDEGLRWLLSDENWRHRGLQGYLYVNEFHEVKKVIDLHITEYEKMVS